MAAPRAILLEVPNRHVETDGGANDLPVFDQERDFVAYSPNRYGEQMVFVQREGEPVATLYHGDYAWQPVRVSRGMPVGLNAHPGEMLFIAACWMESAPLRPDSRDGADSPIIAVLEGIGATIQHLALSESALRRAAES